jgi:signal transduction histidine kinase
MSEQAADRIQVLVHEVRSPVAALAAVAESIHELSDDDAARRRLVRLAVAACAAIERIVADVRVASVHASPMDVGALVRDVVAARAVAGANVEAHVADALPLVAADPVRIGQAVDNLIGNALVHGGDRAVVVRAGRSSDGVTISVADTGGGIEPEELDRIFDAGVRLDAARAGSGLGLALVKAIVDAHGGSIAVESTPGSGSTFTITLSTSP